MRTFALTVAHNESFFLPRWAAYYGAQLGIENLFIVDHGSTDLSTLGLGRSNVIRVPHDTYDEALRVKFVSHMHTALLSYYDAGFVSDADEFLIADPAKYKTLNELASHDESKALAPIGADLFHIRAVEPEFLGHLPILHQRSHILFNSWFCKRAFARVPVRFGMGFHTSNEPVVFNESLFLLHLKYFDYSYSMARQSVTAGWKYAGDFGSHAKQPPRYVKGLFDHVDALFRAKKVSSSMKFADETKGCLDRMIVNSSGEYDFNVESGTIGKDLRALPERFRTLF